MSAREQAQVKATPAPARSFSPTHTNLLQRKCACGGTPGPDGECAECRKKRLGRQRHSTSQAETLIRAFSGAHFGHNFSQVRVHTDARAAEKARGPEAVNSFSDIEDDPIHGTLIEQFREREHLPPGGRDESGTPVGPSEAEIKYGGLLMPCPSSTEVASVIDLRNDALAAGFRTAYGIHSQIRVRPDGRTWDGTRIPERVTMGANTCPDTLTRGEPCSGGSTFTVGSGSGNSPVLAGPRPGARNRFWDFHTTHVRPRNVSVLHDAARNPVNLDTCSTACNQEYICDGNVIGRHTITRTYSKGRHNGQDVTLVDVTKT